MNFVSFCSQRTLESSLVIKMTMLHILFTYIFLFSSAQCIKLMIPHGLLQRNWHDEFSLSANFVLKKPNSQYTNYSLISKSQNNQLLCQFDEICIHSCENPNNKCYVIYTAASEPKGLLQLCQDDLISFSVNSKLPLAFISTTTGKQVITNEIERTRNETIWTFTKIYPFFTLATLQMQPFQVTITNANNTKAKAYINSKAPKYPFDDYAYELMIMNHTQSGFYEIGLLITIGLVVDDLRTYPKTADEQY
jgi:hypothetical protein